MRIAVSPVERLQKEHSVVNIRSVEPEFLYGLNLTGDPLAQLPIPEGRRAREFQLKRSRFERSRRMRRRRSGRLERLARRRIGLGKSLESPRLPEPESGRDASFESQEVLDLATEIAANSQPAHKDEPIRERNT